MKFQVLLAALAATTMAQPTSCPKKTKFCVETNPAPSVQEMSARFADFGHAFLVEKDVEKAFSHMVANYINHNPQAQNGSQWAIDQLKPMWSGTNITVLRIEFIYPQGWLNYISSAYGTIVDRYRFEGGCIVEHWDAGEKLPDNCTTSA
ncbi:uncharacterized protein PgNI_07219 [Pyricularia grisea]|uniref:SnoaL-like domain-containing protein n=1 Tax=Pyricularia grisea TaxID=148305 RepID=A0A6P8B0R6_PYRGI|nr:uncharacterized protein PgNI_07219 [Pyricularia grisea]TLD08308.1 hypothetical protein PgNI_07219 [Pyricularia grisea]